MNLSLWIATCGLHIMPQAQSSSGNKVDLICWCLTTAIGVFLSGPLSRSSRVVASS